MKSPQSSPSRVLLAFLVYLAISLGLAFLSGAFSSDLCGFEDEPAHVVTGMMARDWVTAEFPPPMAFAQDYYLHYPKVAVGQWPPLFYGVQALWTLAFGSGTASLMVLMGLFGAGTATLLFASLRGVKGAVAGALFLSLSSVQAYGAMVMTEVPLALLCTGAALSFGRFLDWGRARDALLFGALAGAACLTKGNALALAGVPLLAIPFSGQWQLLKRPCLWGSALLVALMAAPWYAFTLGISQGSWVGGTGPSSDYAGAAVTYYGRGLVALGGWSLLAAAGVGLVRGLRGEERRGRVAALAAWPPSLLLLHGLVPSSLDVRHLVLIAPALCLLAVAGLASLAAPKPRLGLGLVLALFVLVQVERGALPRKEWRGFTSVAETLAAEGVLDGRALLVVSDVAGEGAFVAAMAQADGAAGRPAHHVLRASKALARSDWMGRDYQLRFEDAADLAHWLEDLPVAVVVQDLAPLPKQRFSHHDQLAEALALHPERWERVGPLTLVKDGVEHPRSLLLWQRRGVVGSPLQLDEDWLLGRDLPGF